MLTYCTFQDILWTVWFHNTNNFLPKMYSYRASALTLALALGRNKLVSIASSTPSISVSTLASKFKGVLDWSKSVGGSVRCEHNLKVVCCVNCHNVWKSSTVSKFSRESVIYSKYQSKSHRKYWINIFTHFRSHPVYKNLKKPHQMAST